MPEEKKRRKEDEVKEKEEERKKKKDEDEEEDEEEELREAREMLEKDEIGDIISDLKETEEEQTLQEYRQKPGE